MCHTKNLLLLGVDLSETGSGSWSTIFVQRLREWDLGFNALNRVLRAILDLYDHLAQENMCLTQEIARLDQQPRYAYQVRVLTSIPDVPGVGRLGAMEIMVELQDVSRFRRADEFVTYLGLTPSQHSSWERTHMGHITHTGYYFVKIAKNRSQLLKSG